jgi:ribokinase
MPRGKIIVVGSSNVDMYIQTEKLPTPGETVLGGGFQMSPGGKGANQAVAAARAGSQVFFVSNVGDDQFGRNTVNNLIKERVAPDYVSLDRHNPTGIAMIIVEKGGQNMIAVAAGANLALSTTQVEKARHELRDANFMLLQMEIPVETVRYAIDMAYRENIPVMLNAAPARAEGLSRETIAKVDTLVVNEFEAALHSGAAVANDVDAERAARALQAMGAKRVVVTMGSKGALAVAKDATYIPARRVEAVDTVGAGDAFCGALATALAEGEEFAQAARFASAAAAIACTKVGAQSSLPERVDIESFGREA